MTHSDGRPENGRSQRTSEGPITGTGEWPEGPVTGAPLAIGTYHTDPKLTDAEKRRQQDDAESGDTDGGEE